MVTPFIEKKIPHILNVQKSLSLTNVYMTGHASDLVQSHQWKWWSNKPLWWTTTSLLIEINIYLRTFETDHGQFLFLAMWDFLILHVSFTGKCMLYSLCQLAKSARQGNLRHPRVRFPYLALLSVLDSIFLPIIFRLNVVSKWYYISYSEECIYK